MLYKLLFSILLCTSGLNAQETKRNSFDNYIHFYFGRGMHGTGDINGFNYGIVYEHEISKHWFTQIAFEGSLHDDEGFPFVWENVDGTVINSTLYDVNAGFQLTLGGGFNFVNSKHHRFGINPAIFGRYQATSLNDEEITMFPALTEYPIPIRVILNYTESRTLAFGGSLKLFYDYRFNNGNAIGLQGAFQIDTNGDTMYYWALRLGKYF